MKAPLSCIVLLLLAGCKPEGAPPVANAPAPSLADTTPAAAPAGPANAATPAIAPPSFDCAKAASEAEKLVCSDAELAALDRRLSARYREAKDADPAIQRGWAKGRDDCWKAQDARLCVLEAYQTRLAELAIAAPGMAVPKKVEYRCSDNRAPFTMTYYNDLDPPAAIMALGNDQAIVFPQPAASGAKYGRVGVEYWEHQGEASVDFFGTRLSCTPLP
ncbi:MliC family protein [Pseudoxanthomonas sp. PXM02]|uniref:MliC family protein n=1 Tax=Pseudoxanthomonas sp. PXM02 TaxID=2769294 RepID=UPI00177C8D20|nr:MliC family protein [Pseudoxanthomonas sp. PXM02]MBD9480380.1 MliC family protein [Pseudoxanthomonas sp. PXM02]